MRTAKKQFILLLMATASFFAYGQDARKSELQPAEPVADIPTMAKELLGNVYVQVGHIPEPLWFEMEPIAEAYAQAILKARAMTDDKEATQFAAEARQAFETAIDAKLNAGQKNTRRLWWNESDTEARQMMEFILSPAVKETARQQMKEKGGTATINYD